MILPHRTRTKRCAGRPAFSLVELLVAMALIIFIMAILSSAFAAASKAFRDLKAAGDLSEKLRGVMTMLRRDLMHPHFNGSTRLSKGDVWRTQTTPQPPVEGFFRIYQSQPVRVSGNAEVLQVPGTVLPGETPDFTTTGMSLHFSVQLTGGLPQDFFTTRLPPLSPLFTLGKLTPLEQDRRYMAIPDYRSNLAEVAYWLTPQLDGNGNQDFSDRESAFPQRLYTLRRRQRLIWPFTEAPYPAISPTDPVHAEVSAPAPQGAPPTVDVNRMNTVFAPPFRFAMQMSPPGDGPLPVTDATYSGQFVAGGYPRNRVDDIIATDVLSFDIQILLAGNTDFVHLDHPSVRQFSGWLNDQNPQQRFRFCNPAYTWTDASGNPRGPFVFDTWSSDRVGRYAYGGGTGAAPIWSQPSTFATIPLFRRRTNTGQYFGPPIRILAIKVTLRMWDPKTNLTRQSTMIQDL